MSKKVKLELQSRRLWNVKVLDGESERLYRVAMDGNLRGVSRRIARDPMFKSMRIVGLEMASDETCYTTWVYVLSRDEDVTGFYT